MSTRINTKLTNFAQKELVIGYNDSERAKIETSLHKLETKLREKLGSKIEEFIRFGSFTRNTILPRDYDPLSDVDLMVVFNTSSWLKTPATYRKHLHDAVASIYPSSLSAKDFPAIKLQLDHIKFDLVPAYYEQSYWSGKTYLIPDSNTTWTISVPNDINQELSKKNQDYGSNVVRNVIRLCKCWNAGANYPFQSYEMEKWIVNRFFYAGDNLYEKFLILLRDMAGDRSGVKQALDRIQDYKGSWLQEADEQKQFQWLQRLLPGLN